MSFNFGTPTTNTSSLTFGTPTTSGGFSFGGAAPTTTSAGTTGFSFGATAATPAATGFGATATPASTGFGATATQASTGFGATAPSAAPATGGFSFGSTPSVSQSTSTPSFGLGLASNVQAVQPTVQTTTPPAFGSTQTTTASTGISFGQSLNPPATTAPPSFNFGQPASTSTATTSAPSLLTLSTTAQTTSSLFSTPAQPLFSNTLSTNTATQPSSTTTTTTSQQQSFVGLGGIDMTANQQKAPEGKIEATKVKETQVPIQILQSVDEFKNYIKNQKTISSEITRSTDRKLKSVTDEIQRLNCSIQEASNTVDTNRAIIKHLRNETAKVIENADMAQRTHETPSGLQFENILPQIYFKDLIQRYETDLLNLKHQVELTEKHLQSLATPQNFTAQELKRGLQQIHECFIALAGRVQDAHTKVENQKEQYLQLRKFILRDNTNVFEKVNQEASMSSATNRVQYGPNVFSAQGGFNFGNIQKPQQQQPQTQPSFNMNAPSTSNTSLFGTSFGFNK